MACAFPLGAARGAEWILGCYRDEGPSRTGDSPGRLSRARTTTLDTCLPRCLLFSAVRAVLCAPTFGLWVLFCALCSALCALYVLSPRSYTAGPQIPWTESRASGGCGGGEGILSGPSGGITKAGAMRERLDCLFLNCAVHSRTLMLEAGRALASCGSRRNAPQCTAMHRNNPLPRRSFRVSLCAVYLDADKFLSVTQTKTLRNCEKLPHRQEVRHSDCECHSQRQKVRSPLTE